MGLAAPGTRAAFLDSFARADPLLGDALQRVVDRDGFLPPPPPPPAPESGAASTAPPPGPPSAPEIPDGMSYGDAIALVAELIEERERSLAQLETDISDLTGAALLEFIAADIGVLQQLVFDPRSTLVVMGGMEAAWWLDDHLEEWLGETHAVDVLTQSVPFNITSEMGLALLDVADAIRPHPEVVDLLGAVEGPDFLDALDSLDGGPAARDAIEGFLDRYGMRCIGEIDITRPRWRERPDQLLPAILGNVRNAAPGDGARRFDEGRRAAELAARDLLARLRALPDGDEKADEAAVRIDRVRAFAGFREYPKYVIVNRYFVYRQALRREATRLVRAGAIRRTDDVDFLSLEELVEVERTGHVDERLIDRRRSDFESFGSLTPPRVLTSDGEAVVGEYRRDDAPAGSLVGLGVSGGAVEGRARVLHDIADADLEPGDILVTAFTDPSWSPLFVAIAGLVTEVGGQMTHGAVVAREYGLPAVVGVERATTLIRDGQRVRLHGREGWVELLDD